MWGWQPRARTGARPPPRRLPPAPRARAHRHSPAAVQALDGRLCLPLAPELHEGAAWKRGRGGAAGAVTGRAAGPSASPGRAPSPLLVPSGLRRTVHSSMWPKGWKRRRTSSSPCCLPSIPTNSFRSSRDQAASEPGRQDPRHRSEAGQSPAEQEWTRPVTSLGQRFRVSARELNPELPWESAQKGRWPVLQEGIWATWGQVQPHHIIFCLTSFLGGWGMLCGSFRPF